MSEYKRSWMGLNGDEWGWMGLNNILVLSIQPHSASHRWMGEISAPFSHNTHSSDMPWIMPPDYRHTDRHLRLVMTPNAHGWTHGRTLASALHYLPRLAADNNLNGSVSFKTWSFWWNKLSENGNAAVQMKRASLHHQCVSIVEAFCF